MKLIIKKATTSKIIQIFIQNSSLTTGAGLNGLIYNSAGLTAYYIKVGDASATAITLATATVGTWTSGGFKEVDATNMPGVYEVGIPDACLTTVAQVVIMLKGAANMAPVVLEIQLDDSTSKDIYDRIGVAGAGLTALGDTRIANLDATISSRSTLTQAQILSDATPFAGANLDAKISDTALASVCTEARLAELDAANLPTDTSKVGKKVDRNFVWLLE